VAIFSFPTVPKTWSALEVATVTFMNNLRDQLLAAGVELNAPTRPGCRVKRTASLSLASTTYALVPMTAADDYDTTAMHDPGGANPERVTIATAGKYHITAGGTFQSGADRVALKLRKNTGGVYTDIAEHHVRGNGGSVTTSISVGSEYDLAVGDHVELWARQEDDDASAAFNLTSAYLTVRFITST
jgi:hypothetical protein